VWVQHSIYSAVIPGLSDVRAAVYATRLVLAMHLYHIGKMMCSGVLVTLPVRFVLSNVGGDGANEGICLELGFVSAYEARNVGD
jgi:hypothetical protein